MISCLMVHKIMNVSRRIAFERIQKGITGQFEMQQEIAKQVSYNYSLRMALTLSCVMITGKSSKFNISSVCGTVD